MLDSTLKQSSLCPGEEFTTFICTAYGTDLVWEIGGRPLSFNRNAIVGTSRTNSERDVTAILIRIDNTEDNGYAVRVSVLTVSVQPQATEMLSVKCHNGSGNLAKEVQYFPRIAGIICSQVLNLVANCLLYNIIQVFLPYQISMLHLTMGV